MSKESYYEDMTELNAWTPDPVLVKSLAFPSICESSPSLLREVDIDVFLYRALSVCMKRKDPNWEFRPQFQKRGTCGGQGAKLAWDITAARYSLTHVVEFPGRCSVAAMYAGSRIEIANKPGNWDGTCGIWLAQLIEKYGVLLLKDLDIPENYYVPNKMDPDEELAIKWVNQREGIPSKFESSLIGKTQISQPRSANEAGKLIQKGFTIITGSTWIPNGRVNSNGFSQVEKGGGHLTCFTAVRYNPFGLLYQNSWGEGWGSNQVRFPDDQPKGSVWLPERDVNQILQDNDYFAFGDTSRLDPMYKASFLNT